MTVAAAVLFLIGVLGACLGTVLYLQSREDRRVVAESKPVVAEASGRDPWDVTHRAIEALDKANERYADLLKTQIAPGAGVARAPEEVIADGGPHIDPDATTRDWSDDYIPDPELGIPPLPEALRQQGDL